MHQGTIVLTGTRTNATGLWIVDATTRRTATITAHPAHHTASAPACYSIARPCPPMATLEQRIAFLHAAMCDPALSTLCSAIDAGFLSSFPEITSALVRKYPPPSRQRWYRGTWTRCVATRVRRDHRPPPCAWRHHQVQIPSPPTPPRHHHNSAQALGATRYMLSTYLRPVRSSPTRPVASLTSRPRGTPICWSSTTTIATTFM